jgi:uncharacterized protein
LPQVAADSRLFIYFRDPAGVFVNLYLPSTLRSTTPDGAQLTLTQSGDYPLDGKIAIRLGLSRVSDFAFRLRIPAWASQAGLPIIRVNGERSSESIRAGFVTLQRSWKDGDRIDLELNLPLRLEPIDSLHPNTVALVRGPLVLFATGENLPTLNRQQLLSASRLPEQPAWQVETASGRLLFRPFSAIQDERYRTYLDVT